jgi:predicted metal-binding membrane protein
MEDKKTKIKAVLLIVLAWLIAIAFAYLVFMKIKMLNSK